MTINRTHRIRCQHCTPGHETVVQVAACHVEAMMQEAEARSEQASEAAAMRYWEEGTEAQHLQYQGELEMERLAIGHN